MTYPNENQISPLPWQAKASGGALCPMEVRILDADGVVILRMETTRNKRVNAEALATAEAIVRAMNATVRMGGGKDSSMSTGNLINEDDYDDEHLRRIPCSRCGQPTTYDPIYGDLCYRCCRASNE